MKATLISLLMLIGGPLLAVSLLYWMRPDFRKIRAALIAGLGIALLNFLLEIYGARYDVYYVRGLWPILNSPLSRNIGWMFLGMSFALASDLAKVMPHPRVSLSLYLGAGIFSGLFLDYLGTAGLDFMSLGNNGNWFYIFIIWLTSVPGVVFLFRFLSQSQRPVLKESRLSEWLSREPLPFPFRKTAILLAKTAFPAGAILDAGGEDTIKRAESVLGRFRMMRLGFGSLLIIFEALSFLSLGKRFSHASTEDRIRMLEQWQNSGSGLKRGFLRILLTPLKYFFASSEEALRRLGTALIYDLIPGLMGEPSEQARARAAIGLRPEPIAAEPNEAWARQILPADDFDADEVLEADAVVVGTGAGGGPVAKELAEKGLAVAIIEAGKFLGREHHTFGVFQATFSLGNTLVLLPWGKAVGGTTFINGGTCFRTPDEVLMRWAEQGMTDFRPERMERYFARVEEIIQVKEADPKYVGPIGEVIRRGADKLGYHSMYLRRNAVSCEGQALCYQGCPHGAKQSTNRSYLPLALKSKATLFTGFTVYEILTKRDRAIGVRAFGRGKTGETIRLTVLAKAVILCAGALHTPVLIQRNNLARKNKWVGRNLSFHPAAGLTAIIPGEDLRIHQCIPQGYCVDEFRGEGLMFEGANIPLTAWAIEQAGAGKKYLEMLERFPNVASFGFMVEEKSRGRVRPGLKGRPLVFYWMNQADLKNLVRGMAILARIFLKAGAERIFCSTYNGFEISSESDVIQFESRVWHPRDFFLSAYHPLGTARIGPGPAVSAIDLDHQCHSVPGLFVVDGSAVPESIGVNPQLTIMALATRAADRIAELLAG